MIARVTQWMERLFDLAVSRSAPGTERERRSRSIVRGTAAALVARGIGSLTGIITVPLTVRYLGAERYGAWMTISSFVVFLNFTDFGLAASLTSAVSKSFGEDDHKRARSYISTSLVTLSAIALLLIIGTINFAEPIGALIFPGIDRTLMEREVIPALIYSVTIFALSFPLMVTNRVLAAYQESAAANIWVAASSVASLLGILLAISFHAGLPLLVLASSGSGLLITALSTVWLFGWHKRWLCPTFLGLDAKFIAEFFSSGWKFFVISAGWMINSQTDNLIIAHYLSAEAVTPYAVTFRLFAYATLIQSLIFPSLWPAYTEAAARKDYGWIQGMYRKNLKLSLLIAVCLLSLLTVFGQQIIRIWAGPAAVPPFSVILWMAVWNVMLATLYVPGCLLNATGHLKGMTIYGTVTAMLNLFLSIMLVRIYGIAGVIAGTVLAYAIASYVPTFLEARAVLRKLALESAPTQLP